MTECFLINSDFSLMLDCNEQIKEKFISVISEMVNYWNLYSLPTMDVSRALSLPMFENLRKTVEMEKMWQEKLLIKSGLDECQESYKEAVLSNQKVVLVFVMQPDKAFIVLTDENGNQVLLDSHVHFENDMESFEVVVARQEARGCMIISNNSTDMLSYIFESLPLSLKCDGSHGFMFTITPKNL